MRGQSQAHQGAGGSGVHHHHHHADDATHTHDGQSSVVWRASTLVVEGGGGECGGGGSRVRWWEWRRDVRWRPSHLCAPQMMRAQNLRSGVIHGVPGCATDKISYLILSYPKGESQCTVGTGERGRCEARKHASNSRPEKAASARRDAPRRAGSILGGSLAKARPRHWHSQRARMHVHVTSPLCS